MVAPVRSSQVPLQAAFVDADSASTAMQAVAPIGVALLKHEQLLL